MPEEGAIGVVAEDCGREEGSRTLSPDASPKVQSLGGDPAQVCYAIKEK